MSATGVKHMCGFNYRFVPAVRLARGLIAAGELGQVVHFRGGTSRTGSSTTRWRTCWRLDKSVAGSGALGDLGAHVVDLAHYLVGEIAAVSGAMRTFTPVRDGTEVDVDDAFASTVEFSGGALGTIEASRVCPGRKNGLRFEINGTGGSLAFNLERLNELELSEGAGGFRTILVTDRDHPFMQNWWPPGHILGGAHLRARARSLPDRDPRRRRRSAARRDVRGRLPRGRGVRRDRSLRRRQRTGPRQLPGIELTCDPADDRRRHRPLAHVSAVEHPGGLGVAVVERQVDVVDRVLDVVAAIDQ